ncbi:MAG: DUF6263 family protein [Ignavibacteriaceae bacterium]
MQKYLLILLIIIFSLTLIQCSSETENKKEKEKLDVAVKEFDSTDLQTTNIEVVAEHDNFSLAYNFREGDSFSYRLTTLSHSERSIKTDTTMSNIFDQKIIRIIKFNTISVENDSIAEVKCNVTNISVEADVNDEKMTYQSGSMLDSTEVTRFMEHEGLVNNPFHFRITKYGELLDVFRLDNLTDRYLKLSGIKDSVKIEEKATFKNNILNNLVKPLLSQIFREVPTQQLYIESTWDKVMDPTPVLVFYLQYTNHFKVSDLEMLNNDRIAIINGIATTTVEGETKHTNKGLNYVFQIPVSTASGKVFFNLDKGMIQKSKTKSLLELSYTMEMPSPQGVMKGVSSEIMANDNILELL